jgi:hypothetical protein
MQHCRKDCGDDSSNGWIRGFLLTDTRVAIDLGFLHEFRNAVCVELKKVGMVYVVIVAIPFCAYCSKSSQGPTVSHRNL